MTIFSRSAGVNDLEKGDIGWAKRSENEVNQADGPGIEPGAVAGIIRKPS